MGTSAKLDSAGIVLDTMLAPMEGVTNPAMRQSLSELGGLEVVCTEFIRISNSPMSVKALRREVIKPPTGKLSVQVMGNWAPGMAEAASVIAQTGADIVDVNLGCPTKRALRGNVGAAMLRDPILLFDVLSAMRAEVPGVLSAKIRAGFDDARNVVHIAQTVERAGADFIAVHPRSRRDHYRGVADWRIVKLLKEELSIPVVGNGDCWYPEDALQLTELTGCDGVMIGRPALRNPWIFRQIQDLKEGRAMYRPCGDEVFAWVKRLIDLYESELGLGLPRLVGRLKELTKYLGRLVGGNRELVKTCLRSKDADELLNNLEAGLRGRSGDELGFSGTRDSTEPSAFQALQAELQVQSLAS